MAGAVSAVEEESGDASAGVAEEEESEKPPQGESEESESGQETEAEEQAEEGEAKEGEETSEQKPVPYERFSEVISQKNEAVSEAESLRNENYRLAEVENKFNGITRDLNRLQEIARFDSKMREFLDHWAIQGRSPSQDEIEDPVAFAEYRAKVGREDALAESESRVSEGESEAKAQEAFATLTKQEEEIKKDPHMKDFATQERLANAYDLLADIAESAKHTGRQPRIHTLKQSLQFLYGDEYIGKIKTSERKNTISEISKPRKILKPATPAKAKPKNPDAMDLQDHIRQATEELSAS